VLEDDCDNDFAAMAAIAQHAILQAAIQPYTHLYIWSDGASKVCLRVSLEDNPNNIIHLSAFQTVTHSVPLVQHLVSTQNRRI